MMVILYIIGFIVAWCLFLSGFIILGENDWELNELNLYETLGFFPHVILIGLLKLIGFLINKLIKTNYVQAFHKFMLQKPSDLIKFRIVLEKK